MLILLLVSKKGIHRKEHDSILHQDTVFEKGHSLIGRFNNIGYRTPIYGAHIQRTAKGICEYTCYIYIHSVEIIWLLKRCVIRDLFFDPLKFYSISGLTQIA